MKTRYELPRMINDMGLSVGAEVGVCYGDFSAVLLEHSNLKKLYSVDIWAGRKGEEQASQAHALLSNYGDRSEVLWASSKEAAATLSDMGVSLDFVYIDAGHRYDSVKQDIQLWFPLLRSGGLFAGHDYVEARGCGVIQAVDEFMVDRPEELRLTNERLKTWWLIKK